MTVSIAVGITAYTQKGHIARATLEATCFQTKAILDSMEKDSGQKLAELAVDGGMTNSDLCMQVRIFLSYLSHPLRSLSLNSPDSYTFPHPPLIPLNPKHSHLFSSNEPTLTNPFPHQTQADLIGIPVERPRMLETTALGAAIAAGFAVGVWSSFEELKSVDPAGTTIFKPKISTEERARRFAKWEKAVEMTRGWEG